MTRLVLLVIAVMVLHGAFALYMADVSRVDQNIVTVPSSPAVTVPEPEVVKPAFDTNLQASITPSTAENPAARGVTGHANKVRSRTLRSDPARFEAKYRTRHRLSNPKKPVPAFASSRPPELKTAKSAFSNRVITYKANVSLPARTFSAVATRLDDDDTPKSKKNSFVSKLQFVYKKPWELIKAFGSKLR